MYNIQIILNFVACIPFPLYIKMAENQTSMPTG